MSESPPPERRGSWNARQISGRLPGKLEALLAVAILGGVVGVAAFIFNFPGPLVVSVRDDQGGAVEDAVVRCFDPLGDQSYRGLTDVFGEAKWPGVHKGPWTCELWPPARYFAEKIEGGAVVVARSLALWKVKVERPTQLLVHVQRPRNAPRAPVAVRAFCPAERGQPAVAWEARAGLMDGLVRLWLPKGRTCRAGLVRPELPNHQPGLVAQPALDCEQSVCTPELSGGVGELLEADLFPSFDEWLAVRPALEPDPITPDAGTPEVPDAGP